MLSTVVFDMGNVLVHFCHERMCRQIAEVCGTTTGEIRHLLIDSGLQWNFERGLISPDELHAQVERLLERTVDQDRLSHAASDIFQLNTPIVPVLDELRGRGLRLVLLSNTSIWHFDFIRASFDVLSRFDAFVLSYQVGAIKPEPPMYQAVIEQLHCPPERAFYTDDIPQYVVSGREYGLHAEVFTDVPTLCGHLQQLGIPLKS